MHDLRAYARQTKVRLVAGGIALTFVVGLGLVYIFYGPGAMATGLVCMLAGFSPVVLIGAALWALEWLVRRQESEAEKPE